MKDRLSDLAGRVDARIGRLLDTMRSLTPEQQGYRPAADAWSPNQVAHHLLLAQSLAVGVIEKNRGRRSKRRSIKQRLGKVGVGTILRFGIKVKNPAPPTTPDPEITFEELGPRWSVERERLRELVAPMDDSSLDKAGFMHPVSGPLSVGESLDFMACHIDHHLKQIDRIRAAPGFPAG